MADYPMTYEQLMDNYEYKVVKRLLKKEYPWIKDVDVKDDNDEINKYNLIFVDVTIDPFELGRQEDWTPSRYLRRRIEDDGEYWSPYLSSFFRDVMWEDARPLQDDINKALASIHSSPALPIDLRLPGTRKFQIGSWYAYPTSITPEDTEQSSDTQL
jgi:hypothetical protein